VSTHATAWSPGKIYYTVNYCVDILTSASRKGVLPAESVKLKLECNDSDISPINFEVDSDHFTEDAVVDVLVNGNGDNNGA
jgi:hypothetical protein